MITANQTSLFLAGYAVLVLALVAFPWIRVVLIGTGGAAGAFKQEVVGMHQLDAGLADVLVFAGEARKLAGLAAPFLDVVEVPVDALRQALRPKQVRMIWLGVAFWTDIWLSQALLARDVAAYTLPIFCKFASGTLRQTGS